MYRPPLITQYYFFGDLITDIERTEENNFIVQGDLKAIQNIADENGINTEPVEYWGIRIWTDEPIGLNGLEEMEIGTQGTMRDPLEFENEYDLKDHLSHEYNLSLDEIDEVVNQMEHLYAFPVTEIEVMELLFSKALKMISMGEICDAKTIILLQYAKINELL